MGDPRLKLSTEHICFKTLVGVQKGGKKPCFWCAPWPWLEGRNEQWFYGGNHGENCKCQDHRPYSTTYHTAHRCVQSSIVLWELEVSQDAFTAQTNKQLDMGLDQSSTPKPWRHTALWCDWHFAVWYNEIPPLWISTSEYQGTEFCC